jgi:multicomponent Na+:H+ antiporter subunit E
MRRVTLSAVVWLTALWVMLWNDVSVANVASGVVLSIVLLAANRLPFAAGATSGSDHRLRISPLHFAYFIVYVVVQLVRSNLSLARKILTRTNTVNAGVIAVPMCTSGEMTMLVMSNVITLTPGTITIEAKGSPAVLYVNVLHLDDVEQVRGELHQLESVCVRAFGSRSARSQLQEARLR